MKAQNYQYLQNIVYSQPEMYYIYFLKLLLISWLLCDEAVVLQRGRGFDFLLRLGSVPAAVTAIQHHILLGSLNGPLQF